MSWIKVYIIAAVCVWIDSALGGVGQGNPRPPTFYNMRQNYSINATDGNFTVLTDPVDSSTRIEVPLEYRRFGYFVIAQTVPSLAGGFSICSERTIDMSSATLYWVGTDCKHAVFKDKWESLRRSVSSFNFKQ